MPVKGFTRAARGCSGSMGRDSCPFILTPLALPPHHSYGGYFSDNPDVAPDGSKLYEYSVASSSWSTVSTSGDSVERSAGGAAAVTPAENGSSQPNFFYFGGHLDSYTTPG